ncbi:MAG: arsenate reductase ArsC [Alphaproteobacteria bacterium]|nr:arsenate reductase ArsC [Alphaproteobacteria bacterium]
MADTDTAVPASQSPQRPTRILFLCHGNASRSIMAEALMKRLGQGKFEAQSGGSHPRGEIDPLTADLLRKENFTLDGLRSKSWDEFEDGKADPFDYVFTVCDTAKGETCPSWPGHPMQAHWPIPDPAKVEGTEAEKRLAVADAYRMLRTRIDIFVNLPLDRLNKGTIQTQLDAIGASSRD